MSFRDNLQYLRSTRNMTQEQLAMMVGVSRQSVTKWEAERAYPEMDKLLKLCKIFDCTIDELVQGDLTTRAVEPAAVLPVDAAASDIVGYEDRMREHARKIALGVAFFVGGCGVGLLAAGLLSGVLPDSSIAISVFVLLFVIAGLAIVIPESSRHTLFMKEHPFIIDFFTSKQRADNSARCSRGIVLGTGLILSAVIVLMVFGGAADSSESLAYTLMGVMMIMIAAGASIITHYGILSDMTNLSEYNLAALCELSDEEAEELLSSRDAAERERYRAKRRAAKLTGALCGITMLVATIIGLLLLFVVEYEMFWVAWVVGGIGCAVIAIVVSLLSKRS